MPLSHPSHARADIKPITDELYVVTMLSNPLRWRSRYRNYWDFEGHVKASGGVLYTVEVAYGDRGFEITSADDSHHLQLRSADELWLKENALNLLIQRLPAAAKYVAWIDADVKFTRPDWVQETLQQLQHYDFVQMFSEAQDLDAGYEKMGPPAHGFGYSYRESIPRMTRPGPLQAATYGSGGYLGGAAGLAQGVYWHPGFAWAARRSALDAVGGLLDFAIMGAGDWHMAKALIGEVGETLTPNYHPTFKRWAWGWQARAEKHVRRNVGYVPGLIFHQYHGEKLDRQYQKRYNLIERNVFSPESDLRRDTQGLYRLNPDNIVLRDNIRRVNRARREDG